MLEFVLVLLIEGMSSLTVQGFNDVLECEKAKERIVAGYTGTQKMEYTIGKQPTRNITAVCVERTKR
jgi:hypothetical protein